MEKAGMPIIPGMSAVPSDKASSRPAKLGYPVIVKASAGGGGKGMRIVHEEKDLLAAVEAGMREAKSAFGDSSVYLEKYIAEPRHVEFQVLADGHGGSSIFSSASARSKDATRRSSRSRPRRP
jgi:acetyl/propionyl-CoA carboxylase alpha subunit